MASGSNPNDALASPDMSSSHASLPPTVDPSTLITTTHELSPLEKLPIELIENVFLENIKENFWLTLASPVISMKLKSKLKTVIIDAFGPSWLLWYGMKTTPDWYWSLSKRPAWSQISHHICSMDHLYSLRPGEGGDIGWQSLILSQPWASLRLILASKDTWIQKHAKCRQKVSHEIAKPSEANDSMEDDGDSQNPGQNDPEAFRLPSNNPETQTALSEDEHLDKEFEHFRFLVERRDPARLDPATFTIDLEAYFGTSIEIKRGVNIPDRLLVGPWTKETTKHLFWLIRSGARSMNDYPWKHGHRYDNQVSGCWAAYTGWKNAVKTGDLTVLSLLRMLISKEDWFKLVDCSELSWIMRHAGGDKMRTIEFVLSTTTSEMTRSRVCKELNDNHNQLEGLEEDRKAFW